MHQINHLPPERMTPEQRRHERTFRVGQADQTKGEGGVHQDEESRRHASWRDHRRQIDGLGIRTYGLMMPDR